MKKLLLSIAFAITIFCVSAAPKYWIGGTSGNWATTTNWSSTSGGTADQAAAPATGDDVYFDANSGATVTVYCIGAVSTLNSLNLTSCNVTFAIVPTVTYSVSATTITTATKTINLANTTSIAAAQLVYIQSGDGAIPFGTTVSSLVSNTSVTLSNYPFAGNPNNPSTIAFVPTTATSITTKTVSLNNSNAISFFTITVNGTVGNGTSTYDFSFLGNSTWTQAPFASGQSITLGNGGTFFITGNSATNYFDGNSNGYITFNTTTAQTVYFNQSSIAANGGIGGSPVTAPTVAGWGGIQSTRGIITIANNLNASRIMFGSNTSNYSQGLILNPNVILGITGNGSSSFNNQTNCQAIDASASGTKVIITSQNASVLGTQSSPYNTPVAGKIFKPGTTVNYLEFNRSGTYYFILPQALTVSNLVLSGGTIQSNGTNLLTLTNSANITRNAGTLSVAPTFGTTTNVTYSNTSAITSSFELPASVVGLTLNGTQAVTLNAPLTVSGSLTLSSGTLTNSATNNITLGDGTNPINITRTAGTIGGTGSTYPTFASQVNLIFNNTSSTTSSYEVPIDASKLNNVTINNTGGVVLSADRTINGTLTLTAGTLTIGTVAIPRTLTFKGNSIVRTSGTIDASITGSGVTFANSSALSLPAGLFSANVNNLTLNGAGGISLSSPLNVDAVLTLTSGKISLGTNDLTIGATGTISGASASSYIITDGTGKLTMPVAAGVDVLMPIGSSASNYDPATVNVATQTTFAAKVNGTLSGTAVYGVVYNPIEWQLIPTAGSISTISLKPSTLHTRVSSSPVIGIYDTTNSIYTNYNSPLVSLNTGTYSGSFDLSSISSLNIVTGSNVDVTGLNKSETSGLNVYAANNQLMISGLTAGDAVALYGLNGQLMKSFVANASQSATTLPQGGYVVKIHTATDTKISKVIIN